MEDLVKEYLNSFYTKNLMLLGDRPEALRWTPEGQRLRYELMLEMAPDLRGRRVLDYGCGKGDLLGFMRDRGLDVGYTGVDINPDLISLASAKYPECHFRVLDAQLEDPGEEFDYVFICGVFNNQVEGVSEALRDVLKRLFARTAKGLAISALSSRASHRDMELHYECPEELFRFAVENITPYVTLRHDRLPDDFTLFLYRKPTAPARGCPG